MPSGVFQISEEAVGGIFKIGGGDEGGIGDEGKRLPVYSIEAGGSGRMIIGCGTSRAYVIGDSVGRYSIGETGVNRLTGTV